MARNRAGFFALFGEGTAEHFNKAVMDDFDHLLAGLNRFDDFFADRLGFDFCDEVFDDGQGDV